MSRVYLWPHPDGTVLFACHTVFERYRCWGDVVHRWGRLLELATAIYVIPTSRIAPEPRRMQ